MNDTNQVESAGGTAEKCLVHVHLYYENMWEDLSSCIRNISLPYDLFVTLATDNEEMRQKIHAEYPEAQVTAVKNLGYDVGPFIEVLNKVNLDDYTYVVKLHSKRDLPDDFRLNRWEMGGSAWREALLDFIRTPEEFQAAHQYLKSHPKLGAVAHWKLHTAKKSQINKHMLAETDERIRSYGWKCCNFKFIAGTMFLMRARFLKPLQHRWTIDDFEPPVQHTSQLAHAIERFMGYLIYREGCSIGDWRVRPKERLITAYRIFLHFLFAAKITTKNRCMVKICKIPVWWGKVKPRS